MYWFRWIVWWASVIGWLIVIVAGLLTAQPAGQVVACCILAVATWIAIYALFAWGLGLRRKAKKHLGLSPKDAAILEHRITPRERINMLRALVAHSGEVNRRFEGLALYSNLQERLNFNCEPVKVEWESVQTNVNEWEEIPSNAVFFLKHNGTPFVAAIAQEWSNTYQYDSTEEYTRIPDGALDLNILAVDRERCRDIREYLLSAAKEHNIFRRRKVVVRPSEDRREGVEVEFSTVSQVARDQIVLPQKIFEVIDRAAIKQMDMDDLLQKAGHRTRTAVLLHGPPGTGKTLLTKHLVGSREDATTIMLQGFRRGLVREAFRLARYCQPSIVVIEDVDLIAVKRQKEGSGTTLLHELLDELDGLAPESRTLVLMTTNRPDVLEPALASRPGRVSQAIEVPLPDDDCRRRILTLFTAKIDASGVDLNDWVNRTNGASPAFLEELVRRAILFATERDAPQLTESGSVSINDDDLAAAINEIITSGGSLTQKLLGYSDTEDPN